MNKLFARPNMKGFVLLGEFRDTRHRAKRSDVNYGVDLQIVWSKHHFTRLDYHLLVLKQFYKFLIV